LIKDNQKNFSRLHMLIDVFVIAASYALAWLIRFQGIYVYADLYHSWICAFISGI